jgi:hypothetical protein
MSTKLTDPYSIPPDQRWYGPDTGRIYRILKERDEAAARFAPCPDQPDPLTARDLRIAELEGRIRELERELASSRSGIEKRKS